MKIKLLRKVRKNYRIVKNGFNVYWIEKKTWSLIPLYENICDSWDVKKICILKSRNGSPYDETSYNDTLSLFRKYLHNIYSEYTRKEKIKNIKRNNTNVVWYKK